MKLTQYLYRLYKRQRGAVSPFLFGMLAGVAIFSAGIRAQAQLETKRILAEQEERAKETADTYRRAVEGALMAETNGSFGTITTNRVNQFVSKSVGGGTRSGSDIAMGSVNVNNTYNGTTVGNTQRVMITTSDDNFVRSRVSALQSAGDANNMATDNLVDRGDVVTIDTQNIRQKQIEETMANMQKQAELMYAFWAQNGRFPGALEYPTEIANKTHLTTFWGDPINCDCTNNDSVTLTAITPWGQTLIVPLNM